MTIYLASDHGGFKLKEVIKKHLHNQGLTVVDCGNAKYQEDDDYPDFVSQAAKEVAAHEGSRGIILGGSGQGEMMVANREKGVRCMLFYGPMTAKEALSIGGEKIDDPFEFVRTSRQHNDSNMLSIGGRFVSDVDALKAVDIWLAEPFSNAQRHIRRIKKF
jgi:ribose 5-phosphate isomerase B